MRHRMRTHRRPIPARQTRGRASQRDRSRA
jgi:hypothetical protein